MQLTARSQESSRIYERERIERWLVLPSPTLSVSILSLGAPRQSSLLSKERWPLSVCDIPCEDALSLGKVGRCFCHAKQTTEYIFEAILEVAVAVFLLTLSQQHIYI